MIVQRKRNVSRAGRQQVRHDNSSSRGSTSARSASGPSTSDRRGAISCVAINVVMTSFRLPTDVHRLETLLHSGNTCKNIYIAPIKIQDQLRNITDHLCSSLPNTRIPCNVTGPSCSSHPNTRPPLHNIVE